MRVLRLGTAILLAGLFAGCADSPTAVDLPLDTPQFSSVPVTTSSSASMLVGTTMTPTWPPGLSTLVEIDPANGATLRTIGPVGYVVNGMEWDPTTGKLYGSTSVRDPSYNGLIEIDVNTGAGTPIGVHRWGGIPGVSNCGYTAVTNITVDASGQMYGWLDPCADDLVRIDKTTGIATWVGDAGLSTLENGLDFDTGDILYMVNGGSHSPGAVYTVDPSTGATSYTGSIGSYGHHGDFDPSTNLYYALTYWPTRELVVADLSTNTVISTFPALDDNMHTLTWVILDPQTKDDCKKGGWMQYGFKNQGQCVRFIETGKDSR